MNITMLGTGNAMVTECYNTCFVLEDGDKHLLVDGGGGNTLYASDGRYPGGSAAIHWRY